MNYKNIALVISFCLGFSNCNNPPKDELHLENYYTFDSNFTNSPSIIIDNDTLMYLRNDGIENVYFEAVDVKTNRVFQSVLFEEGYSLGYANYDFLHKLYIFPIQLHNLVFQKLDGETKIFKLEETCKIKPLIYDNLVLFQERGCCIKVVRTEDFKTIWTFPTVNFSISQPILKDGKVIVLLNDNTLISIDFVTGKEEWRYQSITGLHIGILYGNTQEKVFILTTDLKDNIELEAIDIKNGKLLSNKKINEPLDVWNISNVIIGNKMYCRGYDKVFIYDLSTLDKLNEYRLNELLRTDLIPYESKVLFSTFNEKKLYYIDNEELKEIQSKINIQDIIVDSNEVYFFSYPELYKVKSNFMK
ncbi:MAG TPA: PQQ-binding-like beta-propeller repeat protein [Edaphocola sp.]|nr:PQQ-binding-like beta-propeller repeat protein [Edaphocola sp.]